LKLYLLVAKESIEETPRKGDGARDSEQEQEKERKSKGKERAAFSSL